MRSEQKMKEKAIFVNPFRMLSPKLDREASRLETLHQQPVSGAVSLEEGLLIMSSKLIEMTRLLSKCVLSSNITQMDRCKELGEEVDKLEKVLTSGLVASEAKGELLKGLIRFPYRLERVGDMLESVLRCCRIKTRNSVALGDKAHEEMDLLFVALMDMLINLRDAFRAPNKVILDHVIGEGKKLNELVEDCKVAHWERLEAGFCPVEASSMFRDILDSVKSASDYIVKMAETLLEIATRPIEEEAL
jgi:Na+/phosphate symporter